MEFFDKVKKTAISVAKVSTRESKKLYSVARLNLEITENQNKIKALYKEVGMDAYKAHKAKKNIAKSIRAKLEKIDALEVTIEALRRRIESIKNTDELGVDDAFEVETEIQDAQIVEDDYEEIDDDETDDDEEVETEPIDPIE